ncbi:hypothetical protein ES332_A07G022700v1 [Gossypium tomentosum]|uniref:LOB domain-containing protein n=1 Tax=Gossypium tomentosum TaxID=34277 RepID=A0A5D2PR82_GOSTO|nr:hypothetical protein ES332_A07G022700v1 [Gossypium tomentosum]
MQSHTATNSAAGSQACAVCKYQRRKCTNNCLLAPFFPANRHKDFLNTRKLFGVRNIIKLIENLNFQQRVIAIRTIIFEANMRAQNPVGGCYGLICDLNNKIDVDEDMKPLFGDNKRDQSFSFDSEGHVVFSDDKKEKQTFCVDSGGSKIQNSDRHVSKQRGGLNQHQLKNDLNGVLVLIRSNLARGANSTMSKSKT